MKKKIIVVSIILLVVVLTSTTCPLFALDTSNSPEVQIAAELDKLNNTVVVSVSLQNNPGIRSYKGILTYDTSLFRVKEIVDKQVLTGNMIDNVKNLIGVNQITLMWYDIDGVDNESNGKIAEICFDVIGGSLEPSCFTIQSMPEDTTNCDEPPKFIDFGSDSASINTGFTLNAVYDANGKMLSVSYNPINLSSFGVGCYKSTFSLMYNYKPLAEKQ